MDKLQWFKFTPSDWMIGKIQRCPEITQARFLRLCCLYWNKDCEISIDDAVIEIDQEHYDVLVSKKIISINDKNINISFLDEQYKKKKKQQSKERIEGSKYISKSEVRNIIFELYGKLCLRCGSLNNISIDHIVPVSVGGLNIIDNLQPLCKKCNSSKGKKTKDYRNGTR